MAAVSACQPSNQPAVEIRGLVTAGPTCPVVTDPPNPSCADRPVEGAVLVVTTDAGSEVARAISDADGAFGLTLPPGTYRLTPQPVDGLMGTPGPIDFAVESVAPARPRRSRTTPVSASPTGRCPRRTAL
jgi:hypothetical protein